MKQLRGIGRSDFGSLLFSRPGFKDLFDKLRDYCDYKDLESKELDDEPGNHSEEDLHNAKSTYI